VEGQPVYAVVTGTVDVAGATVDGKEVFINAGIYRYDELHLSAIDPAVVRGAPVRAGQMIGLCGHTGTNTDHLHLRVVRPDGWPSPDLVDGLTTLLEPVAHTPPG
jgi:murein DD-endopeptidase MepM/ murein hydrolase activator NlpD